ncbi:phosphoserine phosphatase SerB [Thalassotalea aquiviva]|uniref:phosphoserine phosphatase SerB n=1 Tax=Thalassotalea aquiviva TaxID=3242415 RepID=UPI00352ADA31
MFLSSIALSNENQQAPLSQFFNTTLSQPVSVAIDADELMLTPITDKVNDTVELVVFNHLTLKQLCQLSHLINCPSMILMAINERLGKTSLRFALPTVTDNIAGLNKAVNELALQWQHEIALLQNAPSLSEPGLLVMDMDSTAIEIECIDEIATLAGVGEQVSEVTELAMQGKLDFAESLTARVNALTGACESILAKVGDSLPLMPGLEDIVKALHQKQWKVAVASGGFTYFTQILADKLNLDATQANQLDIVDGKLTGKVIGDITDANVKAQTLVKLQQQYQFDKRQTVAMGDGANDLTMMSVANLGVAYKAKPIVQQKATSAINFSGLDVLLHWLK